MGQQNSTQVIYSYETDKKTKNGTNVWRNPINKDKELFSSPNNNLKTLQDTWLQSVENYPNNVCLGQRKGNNNDYQTQTYKEVHIKARNLGSGVLNLNLAQTLSEYQNFKLQMYGIYSKNREEWQIVDIGLSYLYGMVGVPLYDTFGPENITYCIEHSKFSLLFVDNNSLEQIIKMNKSQLGNLQNVVSFDTITQEQLDQLKVKGIQLYTIQQVMEEGTKNVKEFKQIKPDDIFTFSYTSGTTGNPKGAMLTHQNFVSMQAATNNHPQMKVEQTDVHLSYLPLPHLFDRGICSCILAVGASLYFYNGDVLKLKQDLSDVKPTFFASVPRLYNKFYDAIINGIKSAGGLKTYLGEWAIKTKLQNLEQNCDYNHKLWDLLVFKKIREVFGGNIRMLVTGSAPIDKNVLNFFKIALSVPFIEGYGQTESSACSFMTQKDDPFGGHVGGVSVNQEFKLQDIPEMQYLSTDKDEEGNRAPRGEICFRGPAVFKGYYKDQEKTKEAIDNEGWLHSGDVGVINVKNGSLKIIDRKKNIFKLSQGEYIAPEKIESYYTKAEGVAEMFVYGDSLKHYLVGIAVPDPVILEKYAKELNLENNLEQLCQNQTIIQKILKNIITQGKSAKLVGFEQIKYLYLEPQSFALHGCLTNTMKIQRHQAKIKFKNIIEKLYQQQ